MTMILDRPPNPLIIGLDLGQARDWTALTVAERHPASVLHQRPYRYQIRHLERWHPERYPAVVTRVEEIVAKLRTTGLVWEGGRLVPQRPAVTLVVDRTGVGRAVGDLFLDARLDVELVLVTITGGEIVTGDAREGYRVPKRDLAGTVAVLLQTGRLEIAVELAHAETLRAELKNFRARISLTGHDSYGAGEEWREGKHDDLVLATALALWQAERTSGGPVTSLSYLGVGNDDDEDDRDLTWFTG